MDGLVVYKEDAANIELALVLIEEARELDPEEPFYHKFAARMAARTGRVDRAEAIIRAWLELKQAANDRAQAWLLWGQTLEAAGRRPEAEDRFRRVVELAGGDQENLKSNVNHVVLAAARSSLAQPRRRRLEHLAVLDEMLE
jgi:tetratricopeptide (TPR) repeat protein